MKRPALLAAAIVLVSCALAVLQGMRNQSGDQTGFMTLKVGVQARVVQTDEENSGSSVQLIRAGDFKSEYFDQAKLAELGFKAGTQRREQSRVVFVVLEWIDQGPFQIVDAGLDGPTLQARYTDRSKYLITRASMTRPPGHDAVRVNSMLPGVLYVPSGTPTGDEIRVRSGRNQIPYVVPTPP